jgi:hypothetical protein
LRALEWTTAGLLRLTVPHLYSRANNGR